MGAGFFINDQSAAGGSRRRPRGQIIHCRPETSGDDDRIADPPEVAQRTDDIRLIVADRKMPLDPQPFRKQQGSDCAGIRIGQLSADQFIADAQR